MPSRSVKQRNLIFAVRNKYKSKSKTPKKWKWVWGDEWLKIKESYIKKFGEFLFESNDFVYKEVNDYDISKIIDITFDSYDKIGMILDEALQEDRIEYNLCSWNFLENDDSIMKDIVKILDKVKDVYVLIIELEDEWFVAEVVYDIDNSKYYLCDQIQGLEQFIDHNFYI